MVTLSPATLDDAGRLLEWRNDPVTREQSFHSDVIALDAHLRWLRDTLARPDVRLYTARDDERGVWVGSGRLDRIADGIELSIVVAPDQRERGYAVQIIEALLQRAGMMDPQARALARVRRGNPRSLRAFAAAGFEVVEERDGVSELARPIS